MKNFLNELLGNTLLNPLVWMAALLLIIIGAAVALFKAVRKWHKRPKIGPQVAPVPDKINLYGDSIVYGGYMSADKTQQRIETPMSAQIAHMLGVTVSDRSMNGDTISRVYELFFSDGHDGETTVIELGLNDSTLGTDVRKMLTEMVEFELNHNRKVVLTGLISCDPPNPRRDAMNLTIHGIAELYDLPFANWGSVEFTGHAQDTMDGLHPNQAYSERLVERLCATLTGAH